MIEVKDKKKCTGCYCCLNVCPVTAIVMIEDNEGFRYPQVDVNKCIQCSKCEKVCPMLNGNINKMKENKNFHTIFYAAQVKKMHELNTVSSGGVFWALAQFIINSGGVVYGAVQEGIENIYHDRAETIEMARKFCRSKYFQSNIGNTYIKVKEDLSTNRVVLFSGTGCQIAGLNMFLGKSYENLYTCDVVCHGVPSMVVWRKYRMEHEKKINKKMVSLVFRDKSNGWSNNQYCITYSDGSLMKEKSIRHIFHSGYLQGLFNRPSCGSCEFSTMPRMSDITLADFWAYSGKLMKEKGDIGISLVAVNNNKGNKLLTKASDNLILELSRKEDALNSCKHMNEHPMENTKRNLFFEELELNGFYSAANKFIEKIKNPSFIRVVARKLKKRLREEWFDHGYKR